MTNQKVRFQVFFFQFFPSSVQLNILKLSQQRLSKPAKKKARLSSSLGVICAYCAEPVTNLDLKSKNNFVKCSHHKVHKHRQQECLEAHSNYF